MARMRIIKPEFWTDGDVVEMSPFARLLFIGTWNFALCDRGHLPDDPKRLKLQILPLDDVDIHALVDELLKSGRIERIETPNGRSYLHIRRFEDHQRFEKRWNSRCPACAALTSDNLSEPRQTSREHAQTLATSSQYGTVRDGTEEPPVVPRAEPDEPEPPKRASRKRPAKPLPDDWQPTEAHLAKVKELGLDGPRELAKFKAHAEANDRRQVNWNAAFTQWLLNARPGNVRPLDTGIAKPKSRPAPEGPFQYRPARPGEENRLR